MDAAEAAIASHAQPTQGKRSTVAGRSSPTLGTRASGSPVSDASVAPSLIPGRFSIFEDPWTKCVTDDKRVYYFNRATGVSQWHTPDNLYDSRYLSAHMGTKSMMKIKAKCKRINDNDTYRMPGSARAMLRVDVVTEDPPAAPQENSVGDAYKRDVFRQLASGPKEVQRRDPEPIKPVPLLRIKIIGARGLRDTDFMPGVDKSDPYCTCEVLGKPDSLFNTAVVADCLDPVWNHVELVSNFQAGDELSFHIWDEDDATQAKNADRLRQGSAPKALFDSGDDLLGRLVLKADEVLEHGVREFRLVDAGRDIDAFLTIETCSLQAWPTFLGMKVADAIYEIERAVEGMDAIGYEVPDAGCEVVSFDPLHVQHGYSGNFVGVYSDSASKLKVGSIIMVTGSGKFTISGFGDEDENQHKKGRKICYIYFQEDITGTVGDKTKWRKVTRVPEKGYDPNRTIVWYEAVNNTVVEIPCIG